MAKFCLNKQNCSAGLPWQYSSLKCQVIVLVSLMMIFITKILNGNNHLHHLHNGWLSFGAQSTAVWARNIEWELLNGKTLLTLFAQNDQFIMTFFDCTMNVRYVGGTWWSPSNYWWWLLVISTPLPNCGGYAAEIHHFAEVMRWQKHILGRIGCTKMQFELRFNSLQFWIF